MTAPAYLKGKFSIITGASSGIGYAIAERMAPHVATLVMLSHDSDRLLPAAKKIRELAPQTTIEPITADITDNDGLTQIAKILTGKYGAPDIIVNNAGYAHYNMFHEMTLAEVVRHANVNLIGAMRVAHVFLPSMRAAKCGQIVNVASVAGEFLITPNLVYSAAKHGMVAWSEGLALELEPDNIAVQVISPGRVETDFFRHHTFTERLAGAETRMTVPLGRVADACVTAIIKRKKYLVIPAYWAVFAWALRACPWLFKPLYYGILRSRLRRLR
ncbi:MAG: SDR family NAD(P)-dependent oxidoreductase [Alphaproteobacteria bacterium]|nr:SDR family NAD(P)-dependent oxidoreductase [Alphaproteobacteria bacterium]